jgi:hypothetical protein
MVDAPNADILRKGEGHIVLKRETSRGAKYSSLFGGVPTKSNSFQEEGKNLLFFYT